MKYKLLAYCGILFYIFGVVSSIQNDGFNYFSENVKILSIVLNILFCLSTIVILWRKNNDISISTICLISIIILLGFLKDSDFQISHFKFFKIGVNLMLIMGFVWFIIIIIFLLNYEKKISYTITNIFKFFVFEIILFIFINYIIFLGIKYGITPILNWMNTLSLFWNIVIFILGWSTIFAIINGLFITIGGGISVGLNFIFKLKATKSLIYISYSIAVINFIYNIVFLWESIPTKNLWDYLITLPLCGSLIYGLNNFFRIDILID